MAKWRYKLSPYKLLELFRKRLKEAPNPYKNPRWADKYGHWYLGAQRLVELSRKVKEADDERE